MHTTNTVLPRCRYGVLTGKKRHDTFCVMYANIHYISNINSIYKNFFCIKKEKACNAIKHSAAAVYIFQSHTFLSNVPFLKHFLNQNTIPAFPATMNML